MPRLTHNKIADVEPVGPVQLVKAATTTFATRWVRTKRLMPITITVEGAYTGSIQLYGSNSPTQPADGDTTRPPLADALTNEARILNFDEMALEWVGVAGTLSSVAGVDVCVAAG